MLSWCVASLWGLKSLRSKAQVSEGVMNPLIILSLAGLPKRYLLFLFVPGVNLIFMITLSYFICKRFDVSNWIAVVLSVTIFFTFIVLGFGPYKFIGDKNE